MLSHAQYRKLLFLVKRVGRPVLTVSEFLSPEGTQDSKMVLRHDVDRLPGHSLKLARLEREHGIVSTYYFRSDRKGSFPEREIQAIHNMGHEVGFHYENLSRSGGNISAAIDEFIKELTGFRKIAPCSTVAPHGSPLSLCNNASLLMNANLEELGLRGDAVMSFASTIVFYFTDTGGNWNRGRQLNRRDYVGLSPECCSGVTPQNLSEFARLLRERKELVYLNTHPERWGYNIPTHVGTISMDFAANLVKRLICMTRE